MRCFTSNHRMIEAETRFFFFKNKQKKNNTKVKQLSLHKITLKISTAVICVYRIESL